MALTARDVLNMPDLRLNLLAGGGGLAREVRWAHVIELADPVPWLRGGELVLTVGLGLPEDPAGQRAYVRRLAEAGCAGLGFPPGEIMAELPPEVLRAADDLDFPVIAARPPTPFVAITEAVAQWYAEARSRDVRKVIAVQDATARAALRSGVAGVLRELAAGTGAEALVVTARGDPRAVAPSGERPWHAAVIEAVSGDDHAAPARGALSLRHATLDVHVQSLGFSHPPPSGHGVSPLLGWLAVACPAPLTEQVRMLANHTACLLGLEFEGVRAARARAQEQRAALFAAALDGGIPAPESERLLPLPPAPYEVVVARADDMTPQALASPALDALGDILSDPVAEHATAERLVVCPRPEGLVLVLPDRRPRLGAALAARLRALTGRPVTAGAVRARDRARLPSAISGAAALAGRGHPGYAHADDLDAWSLLEDALDADGIRRFTDNVLQRLRDHDTRAAGQSTSGSLLTCLRAYLDAGGNLEAAAQNLGVHRNTLRTRLRTAERVSGRSLDRARDRLELWLAVTLADT
ncbi:MAG TPA: PucR family transcriptional regulator [Streptosporangiaceae bacterium]|jgi:purine catabolism regulator